VRAGCASGAFIIAPSTLCHRQAIPSKDQLPNSQVDDLFNGTRTQTRRMYSVMLFAPAPDLLPGAGTPASTGNFRTSSS
jgi:hypothetical protein